jgi:HD-GYP domain-containing protein (c-di-GMP phosphodiesterase class II)
MSVRKVQRPSKLPQSIKLTDTLKRIQTLEREMSQVIRDMQEKVRQLECLNEFSSLMNSSLDIQVVRQKAIEATCKLLGCEGAVLFLIDRKTAELYSDSGHRLPINDRSIAGYCAMSGESLIINDLAKYPVDTIQKLSKKEKALIPSVIISIPLKAKEKVLGVLQAMNKLLTVPARASQHRWPDFYENDRMLLETLGHSISVAIENSQLYADIKRNFFETVEALAEAIEKKDHYTGGHTKRVVYYALCIAKYLQLTSEQLEQVRLAAVLHDVGKIGIEDKILKKNAPLDAEEWKVMQTHPQLGFDILGRVEGLKDVIGGARYHHERWDGKGYPVGLQGEAIPLIARIVAVADAYDAMVSTRPYRKGLDPKTAYEEILQHRGSQFDPLVVDAFVQAFKCEKMGKGSGGSSFVEKGETVRLSNCD